MVLFCGCEEGVCAEHVGLEEWARVSNAAVNVCFRCEIDDRVNALGHEVVGERVVADVAMHEGMAVVAFQLGEVFEVSGIREIVEVDDADIVACTREMQDEVGADEAASAGDEDGFQCSIPLCDGHCLNRRTHGRIIVARRMWRKAGGGLMSERERQAMADCKCFVALLTARYVLFYNDKGVCVV